MMAIYHLHVKSISRGGGSAIAKVDYIVREGKYQADQDEVLHYAHGNMPRWAENRPKEYWKTADDFERANGRLFVHVEFAIPVELSKDQQKELTSDFCRQLAQTSQGQKLPYSMAIHKGRGENNPHCHLMINERINDGINRAPSEWFRRANSKDPAKGGAQKAEELRSKLWLIDIRKLWSDMANKSLEKYGHNTSIDHRTLAAQGIDREPQYHLGPAAAAMERKNKATDRGTEFQYRLKIDKEIKEQEKEIIQIKAAKLQAEAENAPNPALSNPIQHEVTSMPDEQAAGDLPGSKSEKKIDAPSAAPVVIPVWLQTLQNIEAAKNREQAEAFLAAYAQEVDKLQKEYNKRAKEAKEIERSIYWAKHHIFEYQKKVDVWTSELKSRDATVQEMEAAAKAAKAEQQKLWNQLPEKIRDKINTGKIKKPTSGFSLGLLTTGYNKQIRVYDQVCDRMTAAVSSAAKSRIAATEAKMRRDEDLGLLKSQESKLAESAPKLPTAQEAAHKLGLELATAQDMLRQANARADQQWPERMQERQKKERELHRGM